MTPFAWDLFQKNPGMRDLLLRCTFFEISNAWGMIQQIMIELTKATYVQSKDGHPSNVLNHGGLLIAPATISWMEFKVKGYPPMGFFIHEFDDELDYQGWFPANYQATRYHIVTGILVKQSGHEVTICPDNRHPPRDKELAMMMTSFGLIIVAALIALNTPRAITITPQPRHFGREKTIRNMGHNTGIRPWHIVDIKSHYVDHTGIGRGSRKAYHFVRAHRRCMASGVVTIVHAHWRGDPALGICRGAYRLMPDASEAQ